MASEYNKQMLKVIVAQISRTIGWNSIQTTPLEVLIDILHKYLRDISHETLRYAELNGRTDPCLDDVAMAFRSMNININDLENYVQNVDPVPFAWDVTKYPYPKENHLNFLKHGCKEVVTRPIHVHEHLPPMYPDKEDDVLQQNSMIDNCNNNILVKNEEDVDILTMNGNENVNVIKNNDDDDDDAKNSTIISATTTTLTATTITITTPTTTASINSTVNDIKHQNEPETRLTREITSVIMTTSGFISPAREGKLPDAKVPILPQNDIITPSSSTVNNDNMKNVADDDDDDGENKKMDKLSSNKNDINDDKNEIKKNCDKERSAGNNNDSNGNNNNNNSSSGSTAVMPSIVGGLKKKSKKLRSSLIGSTTKAIKSIGANANASTAVKSERKKEKLLKINRRQQQKQQQKLIGSIINTQMGPPPPPPQKQMSAMQQMYLYPPSDSQMAAVIEKQQDNNLQMSQMVMQMKKLPSIKGERKRKHKDLSTDGANNKLTTKKRKTTVQSSSMKSKKLNALMQIQQHQSTDANLLQQQQQLLMMQNNLSSVLSSSSSSSSSANNVNSMDIMQMSKFLPFPTTLPPSASTPTTTSATLTQMPPSLNVSHQNFNTIPSQLSDVQMQTIDGTSDVNVQSQQLPLSTASTISSTSYAYDGKLLNEPDKRKLNIFKRISSAKVKQDDLLKQQHPPHSIPSGMLNSETEIYPIKELPTMMPVNANTGLDTNQSLPFAPIIPSIQTTIMSDSNSIKMTSTPTTTAQSSDIIGIPIANQQRQKLTTKKYTPRKPNSVKLMRKKMSAAAIANAAAIAAVAAGGGTMLTMKQAAKLIAAQQQQQQQPLDFAMKSSSIIVPSSMMKSINEPMKKEPKEKKIRGEKKKLKGKDKKLTTTNTLTADSKSSIQFPAQIPQKFEHLPPTLGNFYDAPKYHQTSSSTASSSLSSVSSAIAAVAAAASVPSTTATNPNFPMLPWSFAGGPGLIPNNPMFNPFRSPFGTNAPGVIPYGLPPFDLMNSFPRFPKRSIIDVNDDLPTQQVLASMEKVQCNVPPLMPDSIKLDDDDDDDNEMNKIVAVTQQHQSTISMTNDDDNTVYDLTSDSNDGIKPTTPPTPKIDDVIVDVAISQLSATPTSTKTNNKIEKQLKKEKEHKKEKKEKMNVTFSMNKTNDVAAVTAAAATAQNTFESATPTFNVDNNVNVVNEQQSLTPSISSSTPPPPSSSASSPIKVKKKKDKKDKLKNKDKSLKHGKEKLDKHHHHHKQDKEIKEKSNKKVKREKKKEKAERAAAAAAAAAAGANVSIGEKMIIDATSVDVGADDRIDDSNFKMQQKQQMSTLSSSSSSSSMLHNDELSTDHNLLQQQAAIPKLTLKLSGSPRPDTPDIHRKITIKPIRKDHREDLSSADNDDTDDILSSSPSSSTKQHYHQPQQQQHHHHHHHREPSPELARISALVTRPPKQKTPSLGASETIGNKDSTVDVPTQIPAPTRGRPKGSTAAAIAAAAAAAASSFAAASLTSTTTALPATVTSSSSSSSTLGGSSSIIDNNQLGDGLTNLLANSSCTSPSLLLVKNLQQRKLNSSPGGVKSEIKSPTKSGGGGNVAILPSTSIKGSVGSSTTSVNEKSLIATGPSSVAGVRDSDGNQVWICPACGRVDDGTPMIGCDGCDAWYHWVCVGIQVPPDANEDWYCRVCIAKKQESQGQNDKKKKRKKKEKKDY